MLLVCNSSSVITSPILLNLREIFLIYCINCGKCKRCLIRNLAFSADVKLIFLSALTRRMWGRSGHCTLCFPLLLVATEPKFWEVLEHCKIHIYTAQHQPALLGLCLGCGEEPGILSFPGYGIVTCPVGQFPGSCIFLTHRMESGGAGETLRLVTPELWGATDPEPWGWHWMDICLFPFFFFFLHICKNSELCPSWMKPLLKKSLLCFCFFFSHFVFSGLSCSIPYSLCALCVDVLEVCFHSPNTTRQKGKRANIFYSLQNKSKDVKELKNLSF